MSSGDIDDTLGSQIELIRLCQNHPQLAVYLSAVQSRFKESRIANTPFVIIDFNYDFDIPFVAGISTDGRRVYIDRHFDINLSYEGSHIDVSTALAAHETTEWALRKYAGIGVDYSTDPSGHRLANRAEFDEVARLCPDFSPEIAWQRYCAFVDPQVKGVESDQIDIVPGDLALYPYRKTPILDRMLEVMQ